VETRHGQPRKTTQTEEDHQHLHGNVSHSPDQFLDFHLPQLTSARAYNPKLVLLALAH